MAAVNPQYQTGLPFIARRAPVKGGETIAIGTAVAFTSLGLVRAQVASTRFHGVALNVYTSAGVQYADVALSSPVMLMTNEAGSTVLAGTPVAAGSAGAFIQTNGGNDHNLGLTLSDIPNGDSGPVMLFSHTGQPYMSSGIIAQAGVYSSTNPTAAVVAGESVQQALTVVVANAQGIPGQTYAPVIVPAPLNVANSILPLIGASPNSHIAVADATTGIITTPAATAYYRAIAAGTPGAVETLMSYGIIYVPYFGSVA